jgi:hypothetical protein
VNVNECELLNGLPAADEHRLGCLLGMHLPFIAAAASGKGKEFTQSVLVGGCQGEKGKKRDGRWEDDRQDTGQDISRWRWRDC